MNTKLMLFALFAAVLCVACGDLQASTDQLNGDSGVPVDMICDPGRQVECACVGGAKGAQICAIDGTHYLACQCPSSPEGGADVQTETGTDDDAGKDAQLPNLNVMLAYDTPAGANLCQNASDVPVFSFTLASWIQDTITKGIRIQRVGAGSVSDIAELRLEISNVYFTGTLVDQSTNVWYFDTPGIHTKVGYPTKLVLHASFNGTPGAKHAFQIMDATALDMTTPANVTGLFPVKGNTFALASCADAGSDAPID